MFLDSGPLFVVALILFFIYHFVTGDLMLVERIGNRILKHCLCLLMADLASVVEMCVWRCFLLCPFVSEEKL